MMNYLSSECIKYFFNHSIHKNIWKNLQQVRFTLFRSVIYLPKVSLRHVFSSYKKISNLEFAEYHDH